MITLRIKESIRIEWSLDREAKLLLRYWELLRRDRFGGELDSVYPPDLEPSFYTRSRQSITIPAGLVQSLLDFLAGYDAAYEVKDERSGASAEFTRSPVLRPYQEAPCRSLVQLQGGVLVAPPGCGKTVMAMHLIATTRRSALWVTHSPELAFQAAEKAKLFLGVDSFNHVDEGAGFYRSESFTIGVPGTKLWAQSHESLTNVGLLVVDEVHKTRSSEALSSIITRCTAGLKIGLTAYEPAAIVTHLIGPVNARISLVDLQRVQGVVLPRYVPVRTNHRGTATNFPRAITGLMGDNHRTEQVGNLVVELATEGHKVLVLANRTAYCLSLGQRLRARLGSTVGVIAGTGEGKTVGRLQTLKRVESGAHTVLIGDETLFEGMDLPFFDRLVLALPTSEPRWILQQAGRIMRPSDGKRDAVMYDMIDTSPECLGQLAQRRVEILRRALDWGSL